MPLLFSIGKKDLIRQTFRAGGKGGQRQNKVETGVRFIHQPSGARAESREHSTQHANEKAAFMRLAQDPKLLRWIHTEAARRLGQLETKTPEQIRKEVDMVVDQDLASGAVLVQYYDAVTGRPEGVMAVEVSEED